MEKIGICTLYTGYNCGSALQAYATKNVLKNINYDADILKLSGSIISGRDVRLKKILITGIRMIFNSKDKKATFKSFGLNNKKNINEKTINSFDNFYNNYIEPKYFTYGQLKKEAKKDTYKDFICGSDQIWNSSTFYVDPFYYLKFAPKNKRVAYAPSFGRSYIPNYNKKIISKNISEMKSISIRETTGKDLIKKLTGKDVEVMIDPTLLLDKEDWKRILNLKNLDDKNYIFAYFLNQPNEKAKKMLNTISKKYNLEIIFFNNNFNNGKSIFGGPIEFLTYLLNARIVMTDSFHGTAFAVNFHKKFFVFDRNYYTETQSTRITSFLEIVKLKHIFNNDEDFKEEEYNFEIADEILNKERQKAINYLKNNL